MCPQGITVIIELTEAERILGVPDLRSLKHTHIHTHENAKTASLKQKPTRKIWNKASKESWAILCCNKQVTGKPAKIYERMDNSYETME